MTEHLRHDQVAMFCENMAMMYQAGIQTGEALRLIAEDGNGSFGHALSHITTAMDEGASFPEALRSTDAFPPHMVNMVTVASKAGRLEATMFALAEYYFEQMRFQDRLRSALIYPMILLILMTGVLLVLTLQILPIFSNVYQTMAGTISATSLRYASIAQTVSYVAVAVILVVAVFFLIGSCLVYFGRRTTTVSRMIDILPFTAKASYSNALSHVINALATYTASGIDPESALTGICTEVGNRKLRTRLGACLDQVREGQSFAQAAFDQKLLEPLYARMLINGERSGAFDETFSYLARLISEDAAKRFDRVVSVIEPVCAAFLAIAVALSLIAIMIPLMGILNALG